MTQWVDLWIDLAIPCHGMAAGHPKHKNQQLMPNGFGYSTFFSVSYLISTGVNHTNESAGRHESSTISATEMSESRIKPEQYELTAINDILAIQIPE